MPEQNSQAVAERAPPGGDPTADPDRRRPRRRGVRRAQRPARLDPRPRPRPPRAQRRGLAGALGGIVEGERIADVRLPGGARRRHRRRSPPARPSVIRNRLLGATHRPDGRARRRARRPVGHHDRPGAGRSHVHRRRRPGMRLREVEIHHADLAAGYTRPTGRRRSSSLLLDAMSTQGVSADRPSTPTRPTSTAPGRSARAARPSPAPAPTSAGGSPAAATGDGLTSDSGTLPQIGTW